MSEGLQKAAGDKLRNILAMMTNNRIVGVLTGFYYCFNTKFVGNNSNDCEFCQCRTTFVRSIHGGNNGRKRGTTATAWIISIFGFKINIAAFSVPLIGFGVPLLFSKKNVHKSWGEFLIGFAFLFLGLDYLNHSMPDLKSNSEFFAVLQNYTQMGFGSILLLLL